MTCAETLASANGQSESGYFVGAATLNLESSSSDTGVTYYEAAAMAPITGGVI